VNMAINFEFHGGQIYSRIDERPLASQERLCCMDLAVYSHFEVAGKRRVQNSYCKFDIAEKVTVSYF
jgi:hypothetical protein